MSQHVVPQRLYFAIFAALMLLTAATVKVAFVDLGVLNLTAALAIAGAKATLVVLYFMHARWSGRLVALAIVGAVFWLLILLVLTLGDFVSRGWLGAAGA